MSITHTLGEAKRMGRKPKHLLSYRGPAIITERISNTTYKLKHEGRTYYRCFSELRPYKSPNLPLDLPMAQDQALQQSELKVGNFVALCDSDDPNDVYFHLCKVVEVEDNKAVLLNYTTWSKNINTATFSIMYQQENTQRYTTEKPKRNAREQEVVDRIDLDVADDYIDHYDVKLTRNMHLSKKSIRQLEQLGLKHHVLGETFP